MSNAKRTLLVLLVAFGSFALSQPLTLNAHTNQDAIDAFDYGFRELAMNIAMEIYQDSGDLVALENYCKFATESGRVREALPYSEKLYFLSSDIRHAALHANRLAFAGELSKAQMWANWVRQNSNGHRSLLDAALSREYKIQFVIRPATLQLQSQQAALAPYLHIPIPTTGTAWQTSNYSVDGAVSHLVVGSGNKRFLEVLPNQDFDDITITCNCTLSPFDCTKDCELAPWGYPASLEIDLQESDSIDFEKPEIMLLAKQLRQATPFETVRSICDFGSKNIFYKPRFPENTFAGGPASVVLARGFGHCEARTSLMVALLRANEIPARILRGHSSLKGDSHPHGVSRLHHSILEFYLEGVGWVPWDFNQTPGVVIPDFLELWSYKKLANDSGAKESTYPLHWVQRLGLTGFADHYDYAMYSIVQRHW